MGREEKTIAVASLTLFVYAIYIFLLDGTFLFPTPLNGILLGIVALYFGLGRIKSGTIAIVSILIGILSLLRSRVLLESFISNQALNEYYSTLLPDLIHLAFGIFVITFALLQFKQQKNVAARTLMMFFVFTYIFVLITNRQDVLILAYAFALLSSQLNKVKRPFHLLWVLFFILEAMIWINYLLY